MSKIQLTCEEHFEPIDVYCKNKQCQLKTRICCNSCSQNFHNHQTTRLNALKKDILAFLKQLEENKNNLERFKEYIDRTNSKYLTLYSLEIISLKKMIENFEAASRTDLINSISKIEDNYSYKLPEAIQNFINEQSSICKNQENTSNLYSNLQKNQVCVSEMKSQTQKKQEDASDQNSQSKIQENVSELQNLILSYKYFLIDEKNEKQALVILDQILEKDKENFIYQRERSRITHEIVEYSTADDRFFHGLYQEAIIEMIPEFIIKKIKYLFYILGLALTYIKNYQEAIKSIEQAITTEPENIQYQRTKSQILFVNNDIESLKIQALDQKNNFSSANLMIEGQILLLQKDYEKAQACFEEAVKINYFSYESYFLLALTISKILNSEGQNNDTLQSLIKQICDDKLFDIKNFNNYQNLYLQNRNQINLNQLQFQNLQKLMQRANTKNKQNQQNLVKSEPTPQTEQPDQ